jgi:hypothetical protein
MKTIWYSRRSFISALAVICITVVGLVNNVDVSMALASVAIGVAGANAFEGLKTSKGIDNPDEKR